MTDRKKITVLLSLCAVLTVTLIFGIFFSGNSGNRRSRNEPLLSAFSPKKISRIEVFGNGESVVLTKNDKFWNVDYSGVPVEASSQTVEKFLETLSALPRGKKITSSEENYDRLGVAADKAVAFIKLTTDNGNEFLLLFGNAVSGEPGLCYVRAEGDSQVFATADPGLAVYSRRSGWVVTDVFPDPQKSAEIQSVIVRGVSPLDEIPLDYVLVRTIGEESSPEFIWKAEGVNDVIDGVKVDSFVRQIMELRAVDRIVPPIGIKKDSAVVTVVLGFRDGTEQVLCISSQSAGEERFAITVDGSGKEYAVSQYALGNILRPLSAFIKSKEE